MYIQVIKFDSWVPYVLLMSFQLAEDPVLYNTYITSQAFTSMIVYTSSSMICKHDCVFSRSICTDGKQTKICQVSTTQIKHGSTVGPS